MPQADNNVSDLGSERGPPQADEGDERERKLQEKRALWERTVPTTIKRVQPHGVPDPNYTFIETDETPTKSYEQRHGEKIERRRKKKVVRQLTLLSSVAH